MHRICRSHIDNISDHICFDRICIGFVDHSGAEHSNRAAECGHSAADHSNRAAECGNRAAEYSNRGADHSNLGAECSDRAADHSYRAAECGNCAAECVTVRQTTVTLRKNATYNLGLI